MRETVERGWGNTHKDGKRQQENDHGYEAEGAASGMQPVIEAAAGVADYDTGVGGHLSGVWCITGQASIAIMLNRL